ncbi:hypothetical protein VUR80DRAFT_1199 [Thermomyces stellatus]
MTLGPCLANAVNSCQSMLHEHLCRQPCPRSKASTHSNPVLVLFAKKKKRFPAPKTVRRKIFPFTIETLVPQGGSSSPDKPRGRHGSPALPPALDFFFRPQSRSLGCSIAGSVIIITIITKKKKRKERKKERKKKRKKALAWRSQC